MNADCWCELTDPTCPNHGVSAYVPSDPEAYRTEHGVCFSCRLAGECACWCRCGGYGSWHESGCPNS